MTQEDLTVNEIKFYRSRQGLTQVQLAKKVGVAQQTIASWETGKVLVGIQFVQPLEQALGVRKEILFPQLRKKLSAKHDAELISEKMDLILPTEIVVNFINRKDSLCTSITNKSLRHVEAVMDNDANTVIDFETTTGMTIVINKDHISSLELGEDMEDWPDNQMKPQVIGDIDEDFDENGDDRQALLFIVGRTEPTALPCPREEDDISKRSGGPSLLSVIDDFISSGGIDNKFFEYNMDHLDRRTVLVRTDQFEMMEAPTEALNLFRKARMRDE